MDPNHAMQTISLVILNTAPLDGVTELDLSLATVRAIDGRSRAPGLFGERATFIQQITLPASAGTFGIYDPGAGFLAQNKASRLVSLSVVPAVATAFNVADKVSLIGPAGNSTKLLDLVRDNGIFPAVDLPIPVGHKLSFDTTAGVIAGPYRIDMTFLEINTPGDFFGNLGD
jgi:hypothetical protein